MVVVAMVVVRINVVVEVLEVRVPMVFVIIRVCVVV